MLTYAINIFISAGYTLPLFWFRFGTSPDFQQSCRRRSWRESLVDTTRILFNRTLKPDQRSRCFFSYYQVSRTVPILLVEWPPHLCSILKRPFGGESSLVYKTLLRAESFQQKIAAFFEFFN